jgi:stage II sporulation protein AA (anti-sigma F factor antagonist)
MHMETEEVAPGVTKANLTGRLDIGGSLELDLAFSALVGAQRALIVDLSQVDFIASLGLRMLIVGARTVQRKGGRMVLLRPPIAVEAVLISSGTDNVVPILRNLDEAIHAVSG